MHDVRLFILEFASSLIQKDFTLKIIILVLPIYHKKCFSGSEMSLLSIRKVDEVTLLTMINSWSFSLILIIFSEFYTTA